MDQQNIIAQTLQDYGDIIDLPWPPEDRGVDGHHPMPPTKRAAQFMPFAAVKKD